MGQKCLILVDLDICQVWCINKAVRAGVLCVHHQPKGNTENMQNSLQATYDRFAMTYDANRGLFDMSDIFNDFYSQLTQTNGSLLDLGCGAGEPFSKMFVERNWKVTGVDFSEKMIELAKHYVPEMVAIHADMLDVEFEPEQFDAIIAAYSLFHVDRDKHQHLFEKMFRWLQPGGKILFTYATKEYTGKETFSGHKEFLGEQLFYSHGHPETLFTHLESTGFNILETNYREIGGEIFLWVTTEKPDS